MRILFFILFPAVFSTAFSGVKYVAAQIGVGKHIELIVFVVTLLVVLLFTILFGRFFCGFACSFGSYGDFLYEISCRVRKKRKKRPFQFSEKLGNVLCYVKYLVLVAILLLCVAGKSSAVSTFSPWDVFSRLQTLNMPKLGAGVLVFLLISIGMIFEKRFFCRFLCPLGAIFSILPVIPASSIKRDRENCIARCKACKMKCPANLDIASMEEGDHAKMGECFSCGKCMQTCPKSNVHTDAVHGKENVFLWNLVRGILLFIVFCIFIGL